MEFVDLTVIVLHLLERNIYKYQSLVIFWPLSMLSVLCEIVSGVIRAVFSFVSRSGFEVVDRDYTNLADIAV